MNNDFIHWDDSDIDLDYLLGEFTDHEDERLRDSDGHSDRSTGTDLEPEEAEKTMLDTENLPPNNKKSDRKQKYICPICNKMYKTIPGFRGHVSMKHNKPEIKAHENKLHQESGEIELEPESSQLTNCSEWPIQSFEVFKNVIADSVKNTLESLIKVSPTCSENTKKIQYIAVNVNNCCSSVGKIVDLIADPLHGVFSELGFEYDKELMWKRFHKLRLDINFTDQFILLIQPHSHPNFAAPITIYFFQTFLQDLVPLILKNTSVIMEKNIECQPKDMSDYDQNILFYISGFILKALSKKGIEVELFHFNSVPHEKSSFIKKFKKWTEKINRGGLKVPSDNFYLMVRSMEIELRKNVNLDKITETSLVCSKLKEFIMSNIMVKFYLDKFDLGDRKGFIMDIICSVFLKIRGHAIAKLYKKQQQKERQCTQRPLKKSQSLRATLKK